MILGRKLSWNTSVRMDTEYTRGSFSEGESVKALAPRNLDAEDKIPQCIKSTKTMATSINLFKQCFPKNAANRVSPMWSLVQVFGREGKVGVISRLLSTILNTG